MTPQPLPCYAGTPEQEPEQVGVLVDIVGFRNGRESTVRAWFTVLHRGDDVVDVRLPDGWRALCSAVGLDAESTDTEGYIATLAKLKFARAGR
jgi:hypothetical protein